MVLVEADDAETIKAFQTKWQSIDVEIGSGNGHFLVEFAQRYPDIGFIGIEAKKKRCLKIQQKIKSRQIENILVFHGTAEVFLHDFIAVPIHALHVYFPDPWPKTKHRRRRFMKKDMLSELMQLLAPHGKLYFASDVFDYYLQVKILGILETGAMLSDDSIPDEAKGSLFCARTAAVGKKTNGIVLQKI
ncbi:MAG: hypothetical protein JW904_00370 [Spirochaetales bacterium]|nr:hypothetical protein [Spirochaetales bacterium]